MIIRFIFAVAVGTILYILAHGYINPNHYDFSRVPLWLAGTVLITAIFALRRGNRK